MVLSCVLLPLAFVPGSTHTAPHHNPRPQIQQRQTVPLHVTRGPGFGMDGFAPLPPSYEPNDEVRACVI